jgi:hypothetical protein
VLKNEGVFAWQSGFIDLGDNLFGVTVGGATIDNVAGAVFDAQNDSSIVTNNIGTDLFINDGTFKKSAGTGTTTIGVTFNNTGTAEVDSGTLALTGAVTGSGELRIGDGAQLELGRATSEVVNFVGASATLKLDSPANYTGTINGFAVGDAIDLVGTVATGITHDRSSVTVTLSGGGTLNYNITGANGDVFGIFSDLHGGSEIVINALNAIPVPIAPSSLAIAQSVITPISGVGVADTDAVSASESIKVILTDLVGVLSANTNAPGGGGTISGNLAGTQLTIVGSLDQVNADLTTLAYVTASTGTDSIDIATNDNRGANGNGQIAITIGGNEPPVTTVPAAVVAQQGALTFIPGISVADPDAIPVGETITINLSAPTTSALFANTGAPGGGGDITGSATSVLRISGTLDQVNADLSTLSYEAVNTGTNTIFVTTDDGRGPLIDSRQFDVNINMGPVTTVPTAAVVVEDGVVSPLSGISIFDQDAVSANETLTITLTDTKGVFFANAGVPGGGGTMSPSGATQLSIIGTLAELNADLSTLTYRNDSSVIDFIDVATSDGRGGADDHQIPVIVVNAPPVVTVPAAQTFQQGVASAIVGISVADADALTENETIKVDVFDGNGLLAVDTSGGGQISGSGTAFLSIAGSLAEVNAALSSLTFLGSNLSSDTIQINADDQRGGLDSQALAVSVVNAPPVITVPGTQLVQPGTLSAIPGISVADADAVRLDELISVKLESPGGTLTASASGGGDIVIGFGSRVLTIAGTLAQVNADLATLAYSGIGGGNDVISIDAFDGQGGSDHQQLSIFVNVPPVTTVPGAQTVTPGVAAKMSGLNVTDSDEPGADETITVDLSDTSGLLSVAAPGPGGASVNGSGTTHLIIAGSLSLVDLELSSLSYFNSAAGSDTVNVHTDDGRGGSDARTIGVTIFNAPPVTTVPGPQTVAPNVVTKISGISVADADAISASEIIIVDITDASGSLTVNPPPLGGPSVSRSTNHIAIVGSLAEVNAELSSLAYLRGGFGLDTVTIATSDGSGSDSHTIKVTTIAPGNALPVTTVPGAQTALTNVSKPLPGISIADADAVSATEIVTVTLTDAIGILSASNLVPGGGGQISGSSSASRHLTISGTLAEVNADLTSLSYFAFVPGNDTIDVLTDDGRGGIDDHQIVVNVNTPPATTVPGPQIVLPNVTTAILGVSIADADASTAGETITVTLSDTHGTLSANTRAPGGGGKIAQAKNHLTIVGDLAQVNADLSTLTYLEAKTGKDTITVATADGRGGTDSHTISVTIDSRPITTVPASLALQQGPNVFAPGISVSDAGGPSAGITVTLTDASGLLSIPANSQVVGSTVSGAGTTQLMISGTLSQVNADLASLSDIEGSFGNDTITVVTTNTRGFSNNHQIAVSVNAPPVTTAPLVLVVQQHVPTAIPGVNVADADAASAGETIKVVLADTAGKLFANNTPPGGGGTIAGLGTTHLTISGTLAQVNADLSTLSVLENNFGSDSIDVATTDGRPGSDDRHILIDSNAPPVTKIPGPQVVQANAANLIPGINISDADAGTSGQIFVSLSALGVLSVSTNVPGGGGLIVPSSPSFDFLSILGTLAQVNADLSTLTYRPLFPAGTDSIDVATDDLSGGRDDHHIAININAPVATNVPGAQLVQRLLTSAISGVSIFDVDTAFGIAETYTVTLTDTNGALSANAGALFGGGTITGAGTHRLKIIGTAAQVNADLSTLTYLVKIAGTDSIDVAASDGRGSSDDHQIAVSTVAAVTKVAVSPGTGEVTTGHTVRITLDMSEAVSVIGSPLLLLNDGGRASFDTARSSKTGLVFDYSVGSGQVTSDLVVSGIELPANASIQGVVGTNADLSGAGANLGLQINTAGTGAAGPSGGDFSIGSGQELELLGASSASVNFAPGEAGTLKLDASSQFAGQVSGFLIPDVMDLSDISFGADTTLGYAANSGNTGGTLNVNDGAHTANIALLGQYMASQFAMSSDGHGGTLITDPPPDQQQLLAQPQA